MKTQAIEKFMSPFWDERGKSHVRKDIKDNSFSIRAGKKLQVPTQKAYV